MAQLKIDREFITLAQAVKAAGWAGSGGQAKELVRTGQINVNGIAETRPGKKLRVGDEFGISSEPAWRIAASHGEEE